MKQQKFFDVNELLSDISTKVGGKLSGTDQRLSLIVDNEHASGKITTYRLDAGLDAIVCDINFFKGATCSLNLTDPEYLIFHFCSQGFMEHKYVQDLEYEKFEYQQNIVIHNKNGEGNVLRLPKDVVVRSSTIYISKKKLLGVAKIERSHLQNDLLELSNNLMRESRQRYLGGFSPRTADFLKELMRINQEDVTARLRRRTLILSILSSQILAYNRDAELKENNCPLKRIELDKIIGLAAFISENISEPIDLKSLERLSGINSSKLQKGFNYLYEMSVNSFINETRLQTSMNLLDNTEYNISEIVYLIGLSSRSYFSKIFKERYGVRPTDYRSAVTTQ